MLPFLCLGPTNCLAIFVFQPKCFCSCEFCMSILIIKVSGNHPAVLYIFWLWNFSSLLPGYFAWIFFVLQCGPTSLLAVLQTLGKLRRDLQALCALAEKDLQSSLLQDIINDTICLLSNIQPFLDNLNQQAVRWDTVVADKSNQGYSISIPSLWF